jgi:hypothetical protein
MNSSHDFSERIEQELSLARRAEKEGNAGKVRVCCRRAAGYAIMRYLLSHPSPDWGSTALSQLEALGVSPDMPDDIRHAARRLTARISVSFSYEPSFDPLRDACLIIGFLGRD